MFTSATTVQTEFTIDSTKRQDWDFQLKLEKFIAEASESDVYVAANGQWSPKPQA